MQFSNDLKIWKIKILFKPLRGDLLLGMKCRNDLSSVGVTSSF
jgi:hypothetical protein